MDIPYICESTIDDLIRSTIQHLQSNGKKIQPTKGSCTELTGVFLELTNPRARISRTETKGKPFSCLGELCWYLSGTNRLESISYYLPRYSKYAEGDELFGGYGPRLLNFRGINQVTNIIDLLRVKPQSRQAVIQLFDANDLVEEHKDVPCTCTLQFLIRDHTLHMITYMRSNDVFIGLPHDIFCFTMLQEILARTLSVNLGTYKHMVGSLHLYERDEKVAQQFLDEGWQSTDMPMPSMPLGDPWPAIRLLLDSEATIRQGGFIASAELANMDSYWADLIRLLQVFRFWKDNNIDDIKQLSQTMSSPIYRAFIHKKLLLG